METVPGEWGRRRHRYNSKRRSGTFGAAAADRLRSVQGIARGEPAARSSPAPLTHTQERLWRLHKMNPTNPALHIPMAWRIQGSLCLPALERSLNGLVQRHEILRAHFPVIQDQPAQTVKPWEPFKLAVLLTEGDGNVERIRQGIEAAAQLVRQPFDLERHPPFRVGLYEIAPNDYLLALVFHQIGFDGPCKSIVARDLSVLYAAACAGLASGPPALDLSFADYARWERQWWRDEVIGAHLAYWRPRLEKPYLPIPLPTDRPRTPKLISRAGRCGVMLSPELTDALRQAGAQAGGTLFAVLSAAWQMALWQVTGAEDQIIFSSIANRDQPRTRPVLGIFAKVLPMRYSIAGNPSFLQLLHNTVETVSGACLHPFMPLDEMLHLVPQSSQPAGHPLLQVLFSFQNMPPVELKLGGANVRCLPEVENGAVAVDLWLDMADFKHEARGELIYNAELFEAAAIERWANQWLGLLGQIAADPRRRLADYANDTPRAASMSPPRAVIPSPAKNGASERAGQPPLDWLETRLVELWESVFNRRPIGCHENFFRLGGDSLMAMQLVTGIEQLTGKNLPLVTLLNAPTVKGLAEVLRDEGWQPRWTSLVPIKASGSRPPFYCVHGFGGNIVEFEHLSRYIGKDQPLYGIQAQGLDGKKPRLNTVEEMASHYIKEIRQFQPCGPYYLGGSSFGGMVALEIAQQLCASGESVALLAMFDTHAPGYPCYLAATTPLQKKLDSWRLRFQLHWSNLRLTRGRRRAEYIQIKAIRLWRKVKKRAHGQRKLWANRFRELFYPAAIKAVRVAGRKANLVYHPREYPGRITLLRATNQPHRIIEDRTNGWAKYALGGVEVHDVPGHHGSIVREPRVQKLVEVLTACLDRAYQNAAAQQRTLPQVSKPPNPPSDKRSVEVMS